MTNEGLKSILEIQQLVCKYSRAIDRRDFKLLSQLYSKGSEDHHGGMFKGSGEDYVTWVEEALKQTTHTSHQIFNHLIELDPDNNSYAEGEVYTLNVHIMKDSMGKDVNLSTGSRYLDKYTKTTKGWQFLYRKVIADYALESAIPSGELVDSLRSGGAIGGTNKDDPSYGYFKLI
tara:strand:- start:12827 stop:13351 length:525 start_codon:yes stop_codon:yes gene_type:complete